MNFPAVVELPFLSGLVLSAVKGKKKSHLRSGKGMKR